MRVLGIDPGSQVVGYGVVDASASRPALVECGVLELGRQAPLPEKLELIYRGVGELISRHRPDVVAVEDIFYGKNVKTTVVLGHARGVVLLAARQAGVMLAEYTATAVKKAVVGRGAARKEQVQFMVAQHLRLRAAPTPEDAADGVAVALTHLIERSSPLRRLQPR